MSKLDPSDYGFTSAALDRIAELEAENGILKSNIDDWVQTYGELQVENERLKNRLNAEIQRAVEDSEFEAAARMRKIKAASEANRADH